MSEQSIHSGAVAGKPGHVIVEWIEWRSDEARYIGVRHEYSGRQHEDAALWTRGIQRKPFDCVTCAAAIPKGDRSFRPMTSHNYARARMCEGCAEPVS